MTVAPRLLLVELITDERWVHNSRFFPFIAGGARQLGLQAVWLCFGARYSYEKRGKADVSQHLDLTAEDMATLLEHTGELAPTHVVLSDPISDAALEELSRQCAPDVDLLSVSGSFPGYLDGERRLLELSPACKGDRVGGPEGPGRHRPENPSWLASRTDWMLNWLGVAAKRHAGRYLVDAFEPAYDALMANDRARDFSPHLLIMGGISCDHLKPLATNDHYAGVDLDRCVESRGCGYCTHYRGAVSELTRDPVEVARAQLTQALEQGDSGRSCGRYEMYDIRLFARIERFAEMVSDLELPPSTFFFEPRLDRFLALADTLAESVLPRFEAAGHVLSLLRMGAENLVDLENERFNKGIDLEQIDDARSRLAQLGGQFPAAFEYDPTFGYITCSPWTTLEELELGFERALERRLSPGDIWLYTPILLYPGSAMTELALQEGGIVADEFEDVALLYEPVVNHVELGTILPWRFKDRRTGVAFGLTVRFFAAAMRDLHPDTIFHGDALYENLRAELAQRRDRFDRPDLFALQAVRAVADAPDAAPEALLHEALDRYAAARADADSFAAIAGEQEPFDLERQRRHGQLLCMVAERFGEQLGGLEVVDVRDRAGGRSMALTLRLDGVEYRLDLHGRDREGRAWLETTNLAVVHSVDTPVESPAAAAKLELFLTAFGKALERFAPDLLPGGRG